MTKPEFTRILLSEGYELDEINDLWENRPEDIALSSLNETNVREAARKDRDVKGISHWD